MKVVWLSHFIPYPVRGGAAQRSYNLIRQAAARYEVTLVAFNRPRQDAAALARSRAEFESFCHRVEFWEMPAAWRGPRWWAQLALAPFYELPQSCVAYASRRLAVRWRELLAENPDALVHVDSSDLARFLEDATGHPLVLNHHNCESAMLERRASLETNWLKRAVLRHQAAKQVRLEQRWLGRVSLNLTVSAEDSRRLYAHESQASIAEVENGTDVEYFQPQPELLEENTIVFAGSLRWYPNQSALMHFGRAIWPLLRQRRPEIRFIVAGQYPPEFLVKWAHNIPGIEFVPNPLDIRPMIARGAVYVCPMLDGGGSRLKMLDAMAMGKAIVSTTMGAEGLRYEDGRHMRIADRPEDFAGAVLRLLEDRAQRCGLEEAARTHAVREYGWQVIGGRMADAYESVLAPGGSRAVAPQHVNGSNRASLAGNMDSRP
ncbi:MAG: glycosyltransferase family 4 protein [Acidobacteriota bacterium]|nr:glycosyltransferase family 4 protein [Acidobacteriota bacterium]